MSVKKTHRLKGFHFLNHFSASFFLVALFSLLGDEFVNSLMAANPKVPKRNDLSQGVVATVGIQEWSKTCAWAVEAS